MNVVSLLGEFDTGDNILILYRDGSYEVGDLDFAKHFELGEMLHLGKLNHDTVVSAVHFDGNKEWTMVKRFKIETNKIGERYSYLVDHKKSQLLYASVKANPRLQYTMKIGSKKMDGEVNLADFIDVKGWRAIGNRLSDQKLTGVKEIEVEEVAPAVPIKEDSNENDGCPLSTNGARFN